MDDIVYQELKLLTSTLAKANGDNSQGLNTFVTKLVICMYLDALEDNLNIQDEFEHVVATDGTNAVDFFKTLFANLERKYPDFSILFSNTDIPVFDSSARSQFLTCCRLTWLDVSPIIIGDVFQGAIPVSQRRNYGAHYTSENNVLKLIKPLFLDSLYQDFNKAKTSKATLKAFLERLGTLNILDPACGCGNFLIVSFTELKKLEKQALSILQETNSYVSINNFYGIEIDRTASQLAALSMTIVQKIYDKSCVDTPNINCANALTVDWNTILPATKCSYIVGNPPFLGVNSMSAEQKTWLRNVYPKNAHLGSADFVTGWFVKSSDYMLSNKQLKTALLATSSICQGEHVKVLWELLLDKGIHINFAYTAFPWLNGASNNAVVDCVIVGFSYSSCNPILMVYDYKSKHTNTIRCSCISPYLIPCKKPVVVERRNTAFNKTVTLCIGNKPLDGGTLILSEKDRSALLETCPEAERYIRKLIGSNELIKNINRYCLWLIDDDCWKTIPEIVERVEACKKWRYSCISTGDAYTIRDKPWRFREHHDADTAIVIPVLSSYFREYIPIAFKEPMSIVGAQAFMVPNGSYYEFGVITSKMHMAWNRLTSGRLQTSLRYSRDMAFNTFIWPDTNDTQKEKIENLARDILNIRAKYSVPLGELYNSDTMPDDLKLAHSRLDKFVETCYSDRPFHSDEERVSFMLDLYTKAVISETADLSNF